MAEEKEYELLPHDELQKLRDEVNRIKRNPLGGTKEADDLKASVDQLTTVITNFMSMLSNTNDELVHQFEKTSIQSHFNKISDQNEKIAQALLTVAELVQTNTPVPSSEPSPMLSSVSSSPPQIPTQIPSSEPSFQENTFSGDPSSFSQPLDTSSFQPDLPAPHSLPTQPRAPVHNIPPLDESLTSFPEAPANTHPLNSKNMAPEFDLPPPPKKKGVLGIFK